MMRAETSSKGDFNVEPGVQPIAELDSSDDWNIYCGLDDDTDLFGESAWQDLLEADIISTVSAVELLQNSDFAREEPFKLLSRKKMNEYAADAAVHLDILKVNRPVVYNEREDEFLVAAECGDDNIKFTNQPALAIMASVMAQKLFNFKVSVTDSALSDVIGNYAEKWILMPKDAMDTHARVGIGGVSRTSQVLDVPALRSLLPVGAQVRAEQSSIEGKCSLMARSLHYAHNTADDLLVQKASIFQDILLSVDTKGGRYPYLPESVGGLGKPYPFGTTRNIDRHLYSWKRGKFSDIIKTIISRAYTLITSGETSDKFLERIKEAFGDYSPEYTYFRRNLPLFKSLTRPGMERYFMGSFSSDAAANAALRRLRSTGAVVSEKELIMATEVEDHVRRMMSAGLEDFDTLKKLSLSDNRREVKEMRSFKNLRNEFIEVTVFSHGLNSEEKGFALRFGLDTTYKVANFLRGEKFFSSEALDEVYIRGPTKVSFPLMPGGVLINGENAALEDPISEEMSDQVFDLLTWATESEGPVPRDLLEDDDIIFKEVATAVLGCKLPYLVVVVVTSDIKLCRRINLGTTAVVFRIDPSLFRYVRRDYGPVPMDDPGTFGLFSAKLENFLPPRFFDRRNVWVDTGSDRATGFIEYLEPFALPKVEYDRSDNRFVVRETITRESSNHERFACWPEGSIFDVSNVVSASVSSSRRSENPTLSTRGLVSVGGLFSSWGKGARRQASGVGKIATAFISRKTSEPVRPKKISEQDIRRKASAG